jgi:multidrug efflux pump subunit AcrB/outer membrane protein TolC
MNTLIQFFIKRHVLVNLLTLIVLLGGCFAWNTIKKEELPDITFNIIRISTSYSGASATDVEFYITKPIEESLQSIDNVYRITSTSSLGQSSVTLELDRFAKNIDKTVSDIQRLMADLDLPDDVIEQPKVRVFETSKKAIIDVALYYENKTLLDVESRKELQQHLRQLENKLLAEPTIFECRRSGYLKEEITIKANPKQLSFYEIPLTSIASEISRTHARAPSGTLKSGQNQQVTVLSELNTKEKLENIAVQGGFDNSPIKLHKIATISDSFEDSTNIYKINGREGILIEVVKNSQYGILEALEKVKVITQQYQNTTLTNSSIKLVLLDDESIDLRNRLAIVTSNGIIGAILILIILMLFLNKRSGVWVALGIPFSLCATLIACYFLGYTINGITVAAIIIVLGIVVDDAIIISENISKKISEGIPLEKAALDGTSEVIGPIIASILTTCVAFIPLYFFTGRFANLVVYIPPIIVLMLGTSALESFFLLPSHMTLFHKKNSQLKEKTWFEKYENAYERVLNKILPYRYSLLLFFVFLFLAAGYLLKTEFKFVMFPDEESREIILSGTAKEAKTAKETSVIIQPLEDYLARYIGKEGIGVRTEIAKGRRGDSAYENEFRITLEITPSDKRHKTTKILQTEIQTFAKKQQGLSKLRLQTSRFGQSSGSALDIVIQENDDTKRHELLKTVMAALEKHPNISDIEEDIIPTKINYIISYNQEQLKRLSVNPSTISNSLRSILTGRPLYTLFRNDEEIDVKLSVDTPYRESIEKALEVPVENNQNYLIPLKELVTVETIKTQSSIRRQNMKRSSYVYANIKETSPQSPLEIAEEFETHIFPKLLAQFPSAQINFEGEIIDTRESKHNFIISIIVVFALIFIILAILFNSLLKPLRILLIIPFGIIGVIFAFYLHQKTDFGFYASIGTLGMLGVVINDAILLLSNLDTAEQKNDSIIEFTARISKTRLRAILLTTLTTVAGVMPTAYGIGGSDAMLSDMMLALSWGLLFGTAITLLLTPCFYIFEKDLKSKINTVSIPFLTLFIIGTMCMTLSNSVEAKESKLNLKEFIEKAIQNDPKIHAILLDNLKLQYNQNYYVDAEELFFSALTGFTIDKNDIQNNSSLRLTHIIPHRGQELSGSYIINPNNDETDTLGFTFSQDIARNAFGKSIQLDTAIQVIQNDVTRYQIIEAYEDYLAQIMTLYYNWIRHYESYQLAISSYKENKKVLDSVIKRQKQKIADDSDVNKVKLLLWGKEDQLTRTERNYLQSTLQIQQIIRWTNDAKLIPDTTFMLDKIPQNINEELIILKNKSRSFKLLDLFKEKGIKEQDRSARDLMPSLAINASVYQDDNTESAVWASLEFPLKNKQSKADLELKKINLTKIKLTNNSTQYYLENSLSTLYIALESQEKLINSAEHKTTLAKHILIRETENYSYGKINLNDYIDAVNRFDISRFDEIDQKISFQQLSIEWKRLSDTLIDK